MVSACVALHCRATSCGGAHPCRRSPPARPTRRRHPGSASEASARLPPVSDLLESLPPELRSGYSAGCASQGLLPPPFPKPRWTGMHDLQQSCQVACRVRQKSHAH